MGLGKYSPTVNKSYSADKKWYEKFLDKELMSDYDKEGYDSYGYNCLEVDRAGNREEDYMFDENLYEKVEAEWKIIPVIGTEEYLIHFLEKVDLMFKDSMESEKLKNLNLAQKMKFIKFVTSL